MAQGEELLGYAPLDDLQTDTPYNEADDYELFDLPEKMTSVAMRSKMFCILFPNDAHVPGKQLNGPAGVHKIVVKIRG